MKEIRFHGRGGQGAVTASKILAAALVREGHYAQAFATYGGERRGAPVVAMVRLDGAPIRRRSLVYTPDAVVVFDPSLFAVIRPIDGLRPGGLVLVNSPTPVPPESLGGFDVRAVDAARIALAAGLGTATAPIINTAMVGAVAGATGLVAFESLCEAMAPIAEVRYDANCAAARAAYEAMSRGGELGVAL